MAERAANRETDDHRNGKRFLMLLSASIGGMILIELAVIITGLETLPSWSEIPEIAADAWLELLSIATVAGVFTCPATISWLADADLRKALPFVYGISMMIAAAAAFVLTLWRWFEVALIGIGAVILASFIAGRIFPLAKSPTTPCPNCGYDLRSVAEPGCPECGWNRRDSPA